MKLKNLTTNTKLNWLWCILILIGYFLIFSLLNPFFSLFHFKNSFTVLLLRYCVMSPILIIVAFLLKKRDIFRFTWNSFGKGLLTVPYLWAISLFILFLNICVNLFSEPSSFTDRIIYTLCFLGTGFTEEVLFRGIIQSLMDDMNGRKSRKALIKTAVITSLMFGLIHATNYTTIGNESLQILVIMVILVQITNAFGLGLCFSAVMIRHQNIWCTIAIHAFWDFAAMFSYGFFNNGDILNQNSLAESLSRLENIITPEIIIFFIVGCLVIIGIMLTIYISLFSFLVRKRMIIPLLEKPSTPCNEYMPAQGFNGPQESYDKQAPIEDPINYYQSQTGSQINDYDPNPTNRQPDEYDQHPTNQQTDYYETALSDDQDIYSDSNRSNQ